MKNKLTNGRLSINYWVELLSIGLRVVFMSYLKRKFLVSRRYGSSLWGGRRDAVNERSYPPGQHGVLGYSRSSRYSKQLKAVRQLMVHYGMRARQFRNTFDYAKRRKGDTSELFIAFLESRLDSFVYKARLAPSIFAAKQLVSHRHIMVNGKIVNIISYRLKPGDVVSVREVARKIPGVIFATQEDDRSVPDYITVDHENFKATYERMPAIVDVPFAFTVDLNSVIAFYSK